jgi:hypothetical protein
MKRKRHIAVKSFKKQQRKGSLLLLGVVVVISFVSFAFISFFLKEAYVETKGAFLERLSEEKKVADINRSLKMELLAITQKGYVEFAAEERLGLKRPKEEEVLVLR